MCASRPVSSGDIERPFAPISPRLTLVALPAADRWPRLALVLAEADHAAYEAAKFALFKLQETGDLREEMRGLRDLLAVSPDPKSKAWASRKIAELQQDIDNGILFFPAM